MIQRASIHVWRSKPASSSRDDIRNTLENKGGAGWAGDTGRLRGVPTSCRAHRRLLRYGQAQLQALATPKPKNEETPMTDVQYLPVVLMCCH